MLCLCLMEPVVGIAANGTVVLLTHKMAHAEEEAVRTAALPKAALELGKGKYHMHAVGRYSYGRLNIGFKIV